MNKAKIEELTRSIETMAIINGVCQKSPVSAERVDCKRRARDGSIKRYHRIDWFINGNRVSRKDAARFIADGL